MASPFPGMNPYLEHPDVWHDFHGVFVTLMRLELAQQLRDRYQVRMDEHIYVHELDAEERRLLGRPDVHLTPMTTGVIGTSSAMMFAAPAQGTLPIGVDVLHERFIEIRDRQGQRLITVIELLSPSNKCRGPDREQYLSKRRRYLVSDVNLVEIDLLRDGDRMPVTGLPECDYCVVVSPGPSRPTAGLWPIQIADPLPDIPIPLAAGDGPAHLHLQELFQRAFEDGGYGGELYALPLTPPLSAEKSAWADALMAS